MFKLLLLDKDDDLRMLYRHELEAWGYTVVETDKPERILETIMEKMPDLIVIEADLGGWNGLDLFKYIRKQYETLPVILCSAYPHFKYGPKSLASDHLVFKGFDSDELKERIQMSLDGE